MIQKVSLRLPYSQVVVLGPGTRVNVPEWNPGAAFVATDSCILFACLADMDGETELTLGVASDVDPGRCPIFEGKLKTPNYKIVLETVEGDPVLNAKTERQETVVRIWSNRMKEPDKVIVGID